MGLTGVDAYRSNDTGNSASKVSREKSAKSTQSYMDELQKDNPGVNISIGKISDSQFRKYAMSKIGTYNSVLIASNVAERMAQDPAYAAKYERAIKQLPKDTETMRKNTDSNDGVTETKLLATGMIIDENGEIAYWAVVYSGPTTKELQKEREEKIAENKEENKKQQIHIEKAKTEAELLEKIREEHKNSVVQKDSVTISDHEQKKDEPQYATYDRYGQILKQ